MDGCVDDTISSFATEARRYCSLIEGNEFPNSWSFAKTCLSHLLRLYVSALQSPEVEPETTDLLPGVSHERGRRQGNMIAQKLARDYYWEVFEPLEEAKPEPVVGSLSDGLADIWRDLIPAVTEIDEANPASIIEAPWHWRTSFETQWGITPPEPYSPCTPSALVSSPTTAGRTLRATSVKRG